MRPVYREAKRDVLVSFIPCRGKVKIVVDITIFYKDDTELASFEAENKGYRNDIVVMVDGKKFELYATAMLRLQQDFECEIERDGYYCPERNMIIVKDISKEQIEYTVKKLYQAGYFNEAERFFCPEG